MRRAIALLAVLGFVGGALAAGSEPKRIGAVKVVTQGLVVYLKGKPTKVVGRFEEIPLRSGKEVPLPAGTYEVLAVGFHAQDDQKQVWSLRAEAELGRLKTFEVVADETVGLKGGGELQVLVKVRIGPPEGADPKQPRESRSTPAKVVQVTIAYVGQAGEQYSTRVLKGKMAQPDPRVRLVTDAGKVLAEGGYRTSASSDYVGDPLLGHAVGGFSWPVPLLLKEETKFKVEVTPVLGPFKFAPIEEKWYTVSSSS